MSVENVDGDDERARPRGTVTGRHVDGAGPSPALIGLAVVLVLAIVFFFQNGEHTRIDFLFLEKRTTIRLSILVAIVLGILLDRLFTAWWRRRRRSRG